MTSIASRWLAAGSIVFLGFLPGAGAQAPAGQSPPSIALFVDAASSDASVSERALDALSAVWQDAYTPLLIDLARELYGRIDPRMRQFFPPGVAASIRLDEIDWGGVRVNGIPPLDHPRVINAAGERARREPGVRGGGTCASIRGPQVTRLWRSGTAGAGP